MQLELAPIFLKKIVKFSHDKSMRLCAKHYAAMRRVMDQIEDPSDRCSVCGGDGNASHSNSLTPFPFAKIKGRIDVICSIEDALVAFKDKQLKPQDISFLCSSCLLVVLRRVSLRDLGIRDTQLRPGDFDYGPTPPAVGACIKFVRDKLLIEKGKVVPLQDVKREYLRLIADGDSEVERHLALQDSRSLKKYIQPPMAARGIQLEMALERLATIYVRYRLLCG